MALWNKLFNSESRDVPQDGDSFMGNSDGAAVQFTETADEFKLTLWVFRDAKKNHEVKISKSVANSPKIVSVLRNSMSSRHLKINRDAGGNVSFLAINGIAVFNDIPQSQFKPKLET